MSERQIGQCLSLVIPLTRPRNYSQNGRTAFADGFPFLVLSAASVDTLLTRIQGTALHTETPALSALNFRPNIIVSQCDAFAEDSWKEIRISDPTGASPAVPLSLVKPCSRCKMPNVNPYTGEIPSTDKQGGGGDSSADEQGEHDREDLFVTRALKLFRTGEQLHFSPSNDDADSQHPNRWGKSVFFGQNAEPRVERGVIRVGDVIRVQQYQPR
jgi:uncharacterized protein YcbX